MSFSDAPACTFCGEEIGGRRWAPPYHVKFSKKKLGDFASDGSDFVVSHRFKHAFQRSSLTGLQFSHEAIASNVDERFYVAFPAYTLTWVDEEKSGMIVDKRFGCQQCRILQRTHTERIRLIEATWEGQDIFFPSGLFGILLATAGFVQFVDEHLLTNFTFVHEDDFSEDQIY